MSNRWLILTLSLCATAAFAAESVELRHPAIGARCTGDGGKKGPATVTKFSGSLGGPDTRKAWKALIGAGQPGCDAVAAWLNAGAAGEEVDGLADLADELIVQGNADHAAAVLTLLSRDDEPVVRRVLRGLELRMGVVSAELADRFASDPRPKVRQDALSVFIGFHSEGTFKSVYGIPVYEETAYWGAPTPPPQHYVDAVAKILATDGSAVWESVAKYAGRHYREGRLGQDAWIPLLLPMLDAPTDETQKAANIVARHLAWGEVAAIDDVIARVQKSGNAEAMEHLLDGFEERLKEGKGTGKTIERLQALGATEKRAEKLGKAYAKKIK